MGVAVVRNDWDKHGERPSILDFGAVPDGVVVADGAINNGSATLICATSTPFTAGSVGKLISIQQPGGGQFETSILTFISNAQVTLAATYSGTSITAGETAFGTDNGPAIQAAINRVKTFAVGGTIDVPPGIYMTAQQIVTTGRINLRGVNGGVAIIRSLQNHSTGSGYSTGTSVATTPICIGGGSGCTLNITAVSAAGGITTATINAAGTGYTLYDTLQPSGGIGGSILIAAVNGSGGVTAIQIMHGPMVVDAMGAANVTYSWLQGLALDAANIPGSTGLKVNAWNEQCGTKSVLVKGYCYAGYVIIGFACQNWSIEDGYCIASYDPSASGVVGVLLNKTSSTNRIERTTVVGAGGSGPGIYVTFCQVNISVFHVESHAVGVQFDAEGQGIVHGMYGHATVTDNVQILSTNNGGVSCRNLQNGGSTNQVVDALTGNTIASTAAPVLMQYDISTNGTVVFTTVPSVSSLFDLMNILTTFRCQGDLYVGAGSTPDFHLLRSDIDVLQHDTEGLLHQVSGMTAARSGGGLQVGGGGSGSDPTVGILCAGCTGDGSTFTARATSAAIITFASGVIRLYCDSGLSAGSTYTPTERLRIDASGNLFVNGVQGISNTNSLAKITNTGANGLQTFTNGILTNAINPT